MKISLNIDFDTGDQKDSAALKSIMDAIVMHSGNDCMTDNVDAAEYKEAWNQCSWEIIAFALAVLKTSDGISPEKGAYAFFDTLCGTEAQKICGSLTERSISSRVGRTAVICKKIGNFRLMEVAVRRNDKAKRVYIHPEASEALLESLKEDWGKEFFNYMRENSYEMPDLNDLSV